MVLRFIFALLLTSFLPGLALTYVIFRKREIGNVEKICFGFGLSLVATIFISFFLPYLSFLWVLAFYSAFFLAVVPLAVFRVYYEPKMHSNDEIRGYISDGQKKFPIDSLKIALRSQGITNNQIEEAIENIPRDKKIFRAAVLVCAIIFACFVVYSPHLDYPYPFHFDEWRHLEDIMKSIEEGGLVEKGWGTQTEAGFHMWLIPLILLTDMNPVLFYQYIPMIFMAFASLILFSFLKKTTGSFSTGIFGILLLASLKSNVNIFGPWMFVPLTMSFPLIYLFFFSFVRGTSLGNEKFFVLAFVFLLAIFTIYIYSALFAVPILIIYLIFSYRFVLKRWYVVLPVILLPLAGFFFTFKFFPQMGILGIIDWLKQGYGIIYPAIWGGLMPRYRILVFYGLLPCILAGAGLIVSIRKYKIFPIWAVIAGIWFYLNMDYFLKNILIPYLRLIFLFLFSLIPLSAIGLHWAISRINRIKIKPLPAVISAALLLTVFITTYYNYYDVPSNLDLYRFIEPEDVEALRLAEGDVVSTVQMHPMTFKFFNITQDIKFELNFTKLDCDGKEQKIFQYKRQYLLTQEQLDCEFLEPVYAGKIRYLYTISSQG